MQSILKDQEEIKSIIIEWNEIRKKLLNLIVITDESQLSSKIGQILELMSLLKLMFDRYNEIYPHLVESIANSKYSREKIEYHNLLEKVDEILKQKKYLEQDYQLIVRFQLLIARNF